MTKLEGPRALIEIPVNSEVFLLVIDLLLKMYNYELKAIQPSSNKNITYYTYKSEERRLDVVINKKG